MRFHHLESLLSGGGKDIFESKSKKKNVSSTGKVGRWDKLLKWIQLAGVDPKNTLVDVLWSVSIIPIIKPKQSRFPILNDKGGANVEAKELGNQGFSFKSSK